MRIKYSDNPSRQLHHMSKSLIRTFNKPPYKWSACSDASYTNNQHKSYLIAEQNTYLTKAQLEAGRKVVARIVRRHKPRAKYKIHPAFVAPITKKAVGSRMGKGKGGVYKYLCRLQTNAVLFEFINVKRAVLRSLCRSVGLKLTIHLRYVHNR